MPSTIERPELVTYEEARERLLTRRERLQRAVKAAIAKPGFKAWSTTVFIANLLVFSLAVLVHSRPLALVLVLATLVADGAIIWKTLKHSLDPKRVVSEGALLPTEGFPQLRYFVHRLYGRADLVPKISAKQQAKLDAQQSAAAAERFARVTTLLEERIRQIFAMGVHPTIWVGNQKGTSAKSFMAVIMGNILSELLRSVVLLMSASTNTQSATAGNLAGLLDNTLTVRDYHRLINGGANDVTFHDLYRKVNNTPHGLFVISEGTDSSETANFSADKWVVVYKHARKNCSIIILDTGNDDAYRYTVTTRGMRVADVVIVPANNAAKQTLTMTGTTIGFYVSLARRSENNPVKATQPKSGEQISLLDKLRRSIVVFNGIDPEGDLQHYRERLNVGMRRTGVRDTDDINPIVLGVRYDEYLFEAEHALDPTEMDPHTYQDYLVVLANAFETAAALYGIDVPEREELIRDVGLRIP